jgi:hypothetical protein
VRVWCGGDPVIGHPVVADEDDITVERRRRRQNSTVDGPEAWPMGRRCLDRHANPSPQRRISRLNVDGGLSALTSGAAGKG